MASSAPKKSNSAKLQSLIQSTTSANLKKTLLSSLQGGSDAELKALSSLLKPLFDSAKVKKHCVRCHETFYDHTNGPEACKIDHHEEGEEERTWPGESEMTITLACCRIQYSDESNGPEPPFCFVGPHTTYEGGIDYYYDREEKKMEKQRIKEANAEEDDSYLDDSDSDDSLGSAYDWEEGKNENIRTCEWTGCKVKGRKP